MCQGFLRGRGLKHKLQVVITAGDSPPPEQVVSPSLVEGEEKTDLFTSFTTKETTFPPLENMRNAIFYGCDS